jgi:hypothetical protein
MPLDLFSKTVIPEKIPNEMQKVINKLKESSNKEECLKNAYNILITKYRGFKVKTYLRLFDVFESDIGVLWNKNGFLHCANINYVMRILLIRSEFFREKDIFIKWTQIWYISPHQYLCVKVNNNLINTDIWGYVYGVKFGCYARGFYC